MLSDLDLWAYHRSRVYAAGTKTVVLLGASRMSTDFSAPKFRERFPGYRLVRLSVVGAGPAAALRDLAEDENFKGIVICSMTSDSMLHRMREDQQDHVDHYHNESSVNTRFNAFLVAGLQERVVTLNPQLNLKHVLAELALHAQLPPPHYLTTLSDRSRLADYTMLDLAEARRLRVEHRRNEQKENPAPAPDDWIAQAAELEPLIERIQERGGKVVIVRLPTTGVHFQIDEECFPKRLYWDRFAARTSAEMIHFKDIPGMTEFDCPDTSHLDYRDAPRFTEILLDELVRRGILPTLPPQS